VCDNVGSAGGQMQKLPLVEEFIAAPAYQRVTPISKSLYLQSVLSVRFETS